MLQNSHLAPLWEMTRLVDTGGEKVHGFGMAGNYQQNLRKSPNPSKHSRKEFSCQGPLFTALVYPSLEWDFLLGLQYIPEASTGADTGS